jgi:hypothetical protein
MSTDRGIHVAQDRSRSRADAGRQSLQRWCDLGHEALVTREWELLHAICDAELLPRIETAPRVLRATARLAEEADRPFDGQALRQYAQRCDGSAHVDVHPGVDVDETTLQNVESGVESVPVSEATLAVSFRSIYTLLAVAGRVDTQAKSVVPALEYEHQVGERYYSALSPGSKQVELIERDSDADLEATLFTGGQGSGKSTSVETIVEDRIARGHKIIDLMDFTKAENTMYDVPPRDLELQEIRAEMGLDVGFQEHDPPRVEVRVPLTPGIEEMQLPFDTEREEWVVKPFVVAASDLSYRQLVMVLPHVTKTHEQHLRAAYQTLDQSRDNWSLADLARTVRDETNASDTLADRIERSLETAQNKAFVRDKNAPEEFQLNWNEIMMDTDAITSFSLFPIREKSDKLLLASYLLDGMYEARNDLHRTFSLRDYPPVTCVIRELHQIVPSSTSPQEAEATIENYMVDTMSELLALVRHANIEFLCDTQKFKQQLSSDVSKLFTRIFAFGGQRPDIKKVFQTRIGSNTANEQAPKVAKYGDGKCAVVSGDGYSMPIQMAPPRCHHLDAKSDGNGLRFRSEHPTLNEDLRDVPWDTSIPPRLRFDNVDPSPIAEFWYQCVRQTQNGEGWVLRETMHEAYTKWAEANDKPPKSHDDVNSYIKDNFYDDIGRTTKHDRGDGQKRCYWGLELVDD